MDFINNEVTSSLELNNSCFEILILIFFLKLTFLEILDSRISQSFSNEFALSIDDRIKISIFIDFINGKQMIIFNKIHFNLFKLILFFQRNIYQGVGFSQPIDLLCALEVFIIFF